MLQNIIRLSASLTALAVTTNAECFGGLQAITHQGIIDGSALVWPTFEGDFPEVLDTLDEFWPELGKVLNV